MTATLYPRVEFQLTVDTAAYTAGDVVGGLLTLSVPAMVRGGFMDAVVITDAANQKEAYTLWLFNAAPTTIIDADPFAPVIADLQKVITRVAIVANDYVTANNLAHGQVIGLNRVIPSNSGTLYAYLVATETPDYAAASDVWLALDFVPEPRG